MCQLPKSKICQNIGTAKWIARKYILRQIKKWKPKAVIKMTLILHSQGIFWVGLVCCTATRVGFIPLAYLEVQQPVKLPQEYSTGRRGLLFVHLIARIKRVSGEPQLIYLRCVCSWKCHTSSRMSLFVFRFRTVTMMGDLWIPFFPSEVTPSNQIPNTIPLGFRWSSF